MTEVVGTVRAVRSATIAPLISGTVAEVRVGLGSSVRAGDVLVRLSAREIAARLEQSRAVSALAKRERDRADDLEGAGSHLPAPSTTRPWRSRISPRRESPRRAPRPSSLVLRAPFAGVITAKLANAGDTAMPGQALLVLEAPTALRFEARVPEAAVDRLTLGASVPVRIDGLEQELEGRVAEIQPAADDATRTRLVKVDLPQVNGLRSGRFGRLLLATGSFPTVTVPAEAVARQGQLETVFVVDSGNGAVAPDPHRPGAGRLAGGRLRPLRRGTGRAARSGGAGRRSAGRGGPVRRLRRQGVAGAIARAFIDSRLTPLLIIASVLLGLLAIVALPREEEPQIKVPMVDLLVAMPGASAAEVESRVSAPLERLMWEIPGVEYVYSTSQPGQLPGRGSLPGRRGRRSARWSSSTRSCRTTPTGSLPARHRRWSRRGRSTTCRSWPSPSTPGTTTI